MALSQKAESPGKSTKKVSGNARKLPTISIYHPYVVRNSFASAPSEVEPKIPAHCATDDGGGKAMTVIERSCVLHRSIWRDGIGNLALPIRPTRWAIPTAYGISEHSLHVRAGQAEWQD